MNRRGFIGTFATVTTATFAGCASSNPSEDQSSNGGMNGQSTDNGGPVGPEEAVKHYDNAVELLEKNGEEFDNVRQQSILGDDTIDFSASIVTSRTEEARAQLDRASQEDDGRLTEEIETLRRVATYQDTLAQYNEEHLKMTRLLNNGLDYYVDDRYQQAIQTLESTQDQVEPVRSALNDVDEELEAVLDASDSAEMGDGFREGLLMVGDDHKEIHEELNWLDQLLPARINEIKGYEAVESGGNAFEDERYSTARSYCSDAENYFVSAETQLEQLDIEETTSYLTSLVNDSDSLKCEYGHMADASDELAQASQAMQNGNQNQANQHIDQADTYITMAGAC